MKRNELLGSLLTETNLDRLLSVGWYKTTGVLVNLSNDKLNLLLQDIDVPGYLRRKHRIMLARYVVEAAYYEANHDLKHASKTIDSMKKTLLSFYSLGPSRPSC